MPPFLICTGKAALLLPCQQVVGVLGHQGRAQGQWLLARQGLHDIQALVRRALPLGELLRVHAAL